MKLLSKTKRQARSRYVLELSSTEFNFLRLCLNAVIDAAGIIDSLSHVKGFRSDRAITCGGEMDLNPLTIYLELSSSSLYLTRT